LLAGGIGGEIGCNLKTSEKNSEKSIKLVFGVRN